jgi:hypothetical protein
LLRPIQPTAGLVFSGITDHSLQIQLVWRCLWDRSGPGHRALASKYPPVRLPGPSLRLGRARASIGPEGVSCTHPDCVISCRRPNDGRSFGTAFSHGDIRRAGEPGFPGPQRHVRGSPSSAAARRRLAAGPARVRRGHAEGDRGHAAADRRGDVRASPGGTPGENAGQLEHRRTVLPVRAEVYQQRGLSLTYDPAVKRVKAEARPESIMYVDSVRGGT